jgi:trehalose 6-phosphate synthase
MSIDEQRSLLVVSNRLPVSVKRVDGGYQSSISSGGLVTALSGLKTTKFQWFGWPGIEVKDTADREQVSQSLEEHNACPIFLDDDLAQEHYNGFSSKFQSFLDILREVFV